MRDRILLGVALVAALAALAFSVAAFVDHTSTPPRQADVSEQVADLSGRMIALGSRISALEAAAHSATGSAASQATTLRKIATCLPEVMGYVNGLNPQVNSGQVYLQQTAQISSYCSALLYGAPLGRPGP